MLPVCYRVPALSFPKRLKHLPPAPSLCEQFGFVPGKLSLPRARSSQGYKSLKTVCVRPCVYAWLFSDKDQFPKRPSLDKPGPDFTILAPGQTFESNIDTEVFARYEGPKDVAGSIKSGTHVLQI